MADKPDLTAEVRRLMPFAAALGVEGVTGDSGHVRATIQWTQNLCTSGAALHGGVIMGLADVVGGLLAFLNLPDGVAGTTTIESKTNFLRAVTDRYIQADATPLHVGRTTIVIVTDLSDADGRLVGRTTQTQAVLSAP